MTHLTSKHNGFGRLIFLALIIFACLVPGRLSAGELRVGVATADITPKDAAGVLDPLHVKAIVLEQGDSRAALAICDLFNTAEELSQTVRRLAAENTGIPYNNISIISTHTHSSVDYADNLEQYLQKQSAGELSAADKESYPARLIENAVKAIVEAQAALQPVTLQSGSTCCEGISFNRRFLMKDGIIKFNPGFQNPDIDRAVGPVDTDLAMVIFRRAEGEKPFAALDNFAIQTTTFDEAGSISADFPYFLEQSLRSEMSENFVNLYGPGPSADINHWDVSKPGPQMGYEETTKNIGQRLAGAIKAKLPALPYEKSPVLAVRQTIVQVPLQTYSDMDLEWAKGLGSDKAAFLTKIRAKKILTLEKLRKQGDTIAMEVQVIRLGEDTAVVALPGQIFVELGLALKKASPFANTLVFTLANSHSACVPPRKAYTEGSYEVVSSLVDSGSGEMLVEAALRMLKELKAGG